MNHFLKKTKKFAQKFRFDMTTPKGKILKKKSVAKKIWQIASMVAVYGLLSFVVLTALAFAWFSKDLPTPRKIAAMKPAVSTKIYDRTGQTLLYETGEEKRTIVNSDQISQYLKDATISVEDGNFYNHHGIDVKEIISAVGSKVLGRTDRLRGASTITQQYVKNSLLTSDRTLIRKIKEAILAVELEFMYSKDEILTMYLNEIPYGSAFAGAEAASRGYFGKGATELTLAEAATLAAIPQSPTYYSPYGTHVDRLIIRRNYVLDQMVKNNKITSEEALKAKEVDTTTVGVAVRPRKDSILAPHFAMYVMEKIAEKYGEDMIQRQGLKIITSLDFEKQKAAEQAINDGIGKVQKFGGSNAALVAIDPKTGQVLAMVGSKDYFDTAIDGNVNVADSLRQPGSSFKPFTYATAFKRPEFSPSRIIYDFETDFGGGYIPKNYNLRNYGPVTIRTALSNSLNVPAVKTMALVGMDNVIKTAEEMGISTISNPKQRANYGLSLALGVAEVRPVEMASAFGVFANNGIRHEINPVLKISDSADKVLYEYKPEDDPGKEVLDPQVAYQMAHVMSDNNARSMIFGTRSQLYFPDRVVAAKTGTTSDFKDAWTVGYTPSISVAVWTGNSNAVKMKSGADGSVIAAPIFHNFIVSALKNTPNEEFTRPSGIQEITVEKYSSKLPSEYSAETLTDIFASWQIPTEKDNIHRIVRVCKGTNLVAPDSAPAELVENRVITQLHSEMPDNPNWENPVIAWASANGMAMSAPTGSCDISTIIPGVSIASPTNNAEISGNVTITVNATKGEIKTVEFFIDNVLIGQANSAPFEKKFNFDSIDAGAHKITVVGTDINGLTARDEISVNVTAKGGPSISDVDVKVTTSGGIDSAAISWLTDLPTKSEITYQVEGTFVSQKAIDNNYTLPHQIVLNNLLPNRKYNYTIISTDQNGQTDSKSGTFSTK